MANPVLNESALEKATWAQPAARSGVQSSPTYIDDGPISGGPIDGSDDVMTVNGTVTASGVLLMLLLISAAFGWSQTGEPETAVVNGVEQVNYSIPITAWVGVGIGFICVIGLMFKPQLARFVAPVYALAQGFFVGAISRMYETFYDGIVVQAVGATLAVFAVMLFLYRFRIIKVTDRFRRTIIAATLGIMVFYGISFLVSIFAGAGSLSFLSSPSLLGIGFSVVVAGIAAMNLALDFDFIERGVDMRLSKDYEWYAAFGLLVTIVWLYLELLRLLSKLRSR